MSKVLPSEVIAIVEYQCTQTPTDTWEELERPKPGSWSSPDKHGNRSITIKNENKKGKNSTARKWRIETSELYRIRLRIETKCRFCSVLYVTPNPVEIAPMPESGPLKRFEAAPKAIKQTDEMTVTTIYKHSAKYKGTLISTIEVAWPILYPKASTPAVLSSPRSRQTKKRPRDPIDTTTDTKMVTVKRARIQTPTEAIECLQQTKEFLEQFCTTVQSTSPPK